MEGIEGCGKSTQATLFVKRLRSMGISCLETREPGGTAIGQRIRSVILDPRHANMSPETELGLYFADRIQHLREIVWPALEAGRVVVCDRFTDSTLAYQGYGRGLSRRNIRRLDRVMTGGFRPKLTLLLDLPAEDGLRRATRRNASRRSLLLEARFDQEALAFHQRVRRGYLRMARAEPERYAIVPADGTPKSVHEELWRVAWERVGRNLREASRTRSQWKSTTKKKTPTQPQPSGRTVSRKSKK
jgi:dTMP kinase